MKPRLAEFGTAGEDGGAVGKAVVFDIVKRNGEVKAVPFALREQATIMQQIRAHTPEGSPYYTGACGRMPHSRLPGDHMVVCEEKGKPIGRNHIGNLACQILSVWRS